jgi:hypothetical protein
VSRTWYGLVDARMRTNNLHIYGQRRRPAIHPCFWERTIKISLLYDEYSVIHTFAQFSMLGSVIALPKIVCFLLGFLDPDQK